MRFGENLYGLRKSAKMSQEKLAEKMDVSRQSVSKWENGESYPEMDKIMKLCEIFHCKINDLVHENMVDIDSLDEEIKMSVVKLKKEKQAKVKALSKAVSIIAKVGKIISMIVVPVIIVLMFLVPVVVNNTEVVDNEIRMKDSGKIVSVYEDTNSANSLVVKVNSNEVAKEEDKEAIETIKKLFENHSNVEIIVYVEAGLITLVVFMILYVIIFDSLEKLFKNINKGDTPFTLENVKYIKKMAFLLIATILIPAVTSFIFNTMLGLDADMELELTNIVEILFLFSMSYIFEYGYELQKDSNGIIYGEDNENE